MSNILPGSSHVRKRPTAATTTTTVTDTVVYSPRALCGADAIFHYFGVWTVH